MTHWMPGGSIQYTPGGLAWLRQWGPLRYTANTAFVGLVFASHIETSSPADASRYRVWARGQIAYMVGSNPSNFSYIVGYGSAYPLQPHHKASTCPPAPAPCDWPQFSNTAVPNYHTVFGALVGGPGNADQYQDRRTDYVMNEVTLDYNAGFTAAAAAFSALTPFSPTTAVPTGAPVTPPPTVAPSSAAPTTQTSAPSPTIPPSESVACFTSGAYACNGTSEAFYRAGFTELWCTASCFVGGAFHPACVTPGLAGGPQTPTADTRCSCGCASSTTAAPVTVPSTTAAPTAFSGVSALINYTVVNNWGSGCQVQVTARISLPVSTWSVVMTMTPVTSSFQQVWDAVQQSAANGVITLQNAGYNGAVAASGLISFGGLFNGQCPTLVSGTINGVLASIVGDVVSTTPGVTAAPVQSTTSAPSLATTPLATAAPNDVTTAPPSGTSVTATVAHVVQSSYNDGCQFIVEATLSIPVTSWSLVLTMSPPATGVVAWDAVVVSSSGGLATFGNMANNGQVSAFGRISFGGIWSHSGQCPVLQSATVNGVLASLATPAPSTQNPTQPPASMSPTASLPPTTFVASTTPATTTRATDVTNPFVAHPDWYVNPTYIANLDDTINATSSQSTRCTLAGMRDIPSAYWIDVKSKAQVTATSAQDTSMAHGILEHARSHNGKLVTFIIYDLPNRDCHAFASNGEICCSYNPDGTCDYLANPNSCAAGIIEYKTQYIDLL